MRQHTLQLTGRERREKHRLFIRDSVALFTLSLLVVVLSFATYGLFHSFAAHRRMMEQRWQRRGEGAMAAGDPLSAINDLHSALAFAAGDRELEIELATALAAAGHTQEAQTYFNTLLEAEPGSGIINLQLARLAVRQNNIQAAVDDYQAAIDGTWNGDGYTRRREIRLELSRMLIAKKQLPEARNQLLIAAGNAPEDYRLQLQVGEMLLAAADPGDALDTYKKATRSRATRVEALEGEAMAASAMGHYLQTRNLLSSATAESAFHEQPESTRASVRAALSEAEAILDLYPGDELTPSTRGERIARDANLAQARLQACVQTPSANASLGPGAAVAAPGQQQLLSGLAAKLQKLNPLKLGGTGAPTGPANTATDIPSDQLAALSARWTAVPLGPTLAHQLGTDPDLAQNTLQLAYATERATAEACGPPTGQDALLLKIAQAPDQVEAQP